MKRIKSFMLLASLLPLLGGCPQVSNIRIVEDSPNDLESLLSEHEYMRARQLTGKYPALDSTELQKRIRNLEQDYEKSVWNEATTLEANGELHAAVVLLSDALQKLPHSNRLRHLRNSIEHNRVFRLRVNERNTLLAEGRYMSDQLRLHDEKGGLTPSDLLRQMVRERNQSQAEQISADLVEHARLAIVDGELDAAQSCLDVAGSLHPVPEADELQDKLRSIRKTRAKASQQKASAKQARIKKKQSIIHREQTEKLLAETRVALKAGKLRLARETFLKIPESRRDDEGVVAIRAQLDKLIGARVKELVSSGDALYRAEKINPALHAWNEALALSPDDQEIHERTIRANKVLARLEELKRKQ